MLKNWLEVVVQRDEFILDVGNRAYLGPYHRPDYAPRLPDFNLQDGLPSRAVGEPGDTSQL